MEPQEGYEEEEDLASRKELLSEPSPEQYSEASSIYRDESLRSARRVGRDDVTRESPSKGPGGHHEEKSTPRDEGSKRHSSSGQRRPDKEKHERRAWEK